MNSEHPINNMIDVAMSKLKELTNSETVIGEPITMPNGVTAIPVCKVSFGFASGGTDFPNKDTMFGGGTGGGVSIVPIAFLVTTKDSVKILQLDTIGSTADNIVRAVPDVIDKVSSLISGGKNSADAE